MKIKTANLTGRALNWTVCVAEGYRPSTTSLGTPVLLEKDADYYEYFPAALPSFDSDPAQAWPIIAREIHAFDHMQSDRVCAILKRTDMKNGGWNHGYGPTPLIAAMRAYVTSKLGDEVDIPEELTT